VWIFGAGSEDFVHYQPAHCPRLIGEAGKLLRIPSSCGLIFINSLAALSRDASI
jgi:hypothetical protein